MTVKDLQKENAGLIEVISKLMNCGNCEGIKRKTSICAVCEDLNEWEINKDL